MKRRAAPDRLHRARIGVASGKMQRLQPQRDVGGRLAVSSPARIGATHSVVFGGFSAKSLQERIVDAGAVAVITADEQMRGGRALPIKAIVDEALERRRLKLAIQSSIATADAKAEGFGEIRGPRLALMASQVADAFALKERLDPARIFDSSFLPTAAERNIFPK